MHIQVLVIDDDSILTDSIHKALDLVDFDVLYLNRWQVEASQTLGIEPEVIVLHSGDESECSRTRIASIRRISQAPILVVSAKTQPGLAEKWLNDGADEWLLAPVSSRLLAANILKLARRRRMGTPA